MKTESLFVDNGESPAGSNNVNFIWANQFNDV